MHFIVDRTFPLLLLVLLALLAFFLDKMTDTPYFSPGAYTKHPDLTLSNFTASAYGKNGQQQYLLQAAKMLHYPDNRAEFETIVFRHKEPAAESVGRTGSKNRLPNGLQNGDSQRNTSLALGNRPFSVMAKHAQINDKQDELTFQETVMLEILDAGKNPGAILKSSNMQIDLVNKTAQSKNYTEIISGGTQIRTTGFSYDYTTTVLQLRNKVIIDYVFPQL